MNLFSPLLFPVRLENKKIIVLDETKLPFVEDYIEIDSLDKALWVLESMKTRSFGQVLIFFYSCVMFSDSFPLDYITDEFVRRRPTFDFPKLSNILRGGLKEGKNLEEVVNEFIERFDLLRKKRAKELAKILPLSANILTICNVNGELIYLYQALKECGKEAVFFISETRPYLQGTRLTFWELSRNSIPCKLLCDNQVAYLLLKGEINCIVSGADRANLRGDIINKIGTYALARLAKYFRIPLYVFTCYPSDIDIKNIIIEERPEEEVFMFIPKKQIFIDSIYPSFDIVEAEYITKKLEISKYQ
ncbi:MAG: hypothetical protein NC904_06450 [Candidatus Omnitrophica bacterium]|nr:hypothetical protein [Candidatus Omnitrophota bacterium]